METSDEREDCERMRRNSMLSGCAGDSLASHASISSCEGVKSVTAARSKIQSRDAQGLKESEAISCAPLSTGVMRGASRYDQN